MDFLVFILFSLAGDFFGYVSGSSYLQLFQIFLALS